MKNSIGQQMDISGTGDLAGRRFGRMTVVHIAGMKDRRRMWRCRCDCGTEKDIAGTSLRLGRALSCGCQKRIGRKPRHGHATNQKKSKVYSTWRSMFKRCRDKSYHCYHRYGGRGIKICERWAVFENFLADMGEPPTPQHSIDRINNDGNYEPGNCRWATAKEQVNNRGSYAHAATDWTPPDTRCPPFLPPDVEKCQ